MRAIVGPNRAEKSTVKVIFTAQTRIDSATVAFGGCSDSQLRMTRTQIARSGIGLRFQRPTVFEDQTMRENLALALKAARSPWAVPGRQKTAADESRIGALAAQVGVADGLGRKAGILRHG